jgi:hypothetical protein
VHQRRSVGLREIAVRTTALAWLRLLSAAALLCGSVGAWSLGLRCGSRIVAAGMLAPQVRNACGAPFWTDTFATFEILGAGGPIEEQREVDWDVWYYNFGPSNLMQRLSFRDGQLQKVEPLGYGVDEIGTACVPAIAARGITSGELVARCGTPATQQRSDGAIVRRAPGRVRVDEDRREEWLYEDGPDYLVRYRITNGRVTAVDRLPR